MLDFSPFTTVKSTTQPGESFTVRRIGPGERASLELKLSKHRAACRELLDEFRECGRKLDALIKDSPKESDGTPKLVKDPSLVTPEMLKIGSRRTELDEEYAFYMAANVRPEWIRAGFVSLSSAPEIKVEQILNAPYPDFLEEIYQTIYAGAYVNPEQAKTSPSSTTSAAAEDGKTSNTTAENAGKAEDTRLATATDTTQES